MARDVLAIPPVPLDSSPVPNPSGVPAPAPDSSRPMRVLVAEDDREMNAVLAEALARDGHEILAVGNGTEAMAALAGGQQAVLDAAVMDVRMPGLSGLQILAKLRGNGSRLPVIIITAFGEHAIHQQALSLGAARVFDKPFDVDDLRAAVMGLWNELRAAQR